MPHHNYYQWRPHVRAADRQRNANRLIASLRRKGHKVDPVCSEGTFAAYSFWGKAWCMNLESYSELATRLSRGLDYLRGGLVVDLQIRPGRVEALVNGADLYRVSIDVAPTSPEHWKSMVDECAGKIESLAEVLEGKLSLVVMRALARRDGGLLPAPKELRTKCSCPDWSEMCKHVAAVLNGVGTRLDKRPESLFILRQVDHTQLVPGAKAFDFLDLQPVGYAMPKPAEQAGPVGAAVQPQPALPSRVFSAVAAPQPTVSPPTGPAPTEPRGPEPAPAAPAVLQLPTVPTPVPAPVAPAAPQAPPPGPEPVTAAPAVTPPPLPALPAPAPEPVPAPRPEPVAEAVAPMALQPPVPTPVLEPLPEPEPEPVAPEVMPPPALPAPAPETVPASRPEPVAEPVAPAALQPPPPVPEPRQVLEPGGAEPQPPRKTVGRPARGRAKRPAEPKPPGRERARAVPRGRTSPAPATLARAARQPSSGRNPKGTITAADLAELGFPRRTLSEWLSEGFLRPTAKQGVYSTTPASEVRMDRARRAKKR